MHAGAGELLEFRLDGSFRIGCRPELVPAPGQYLLAHASASNAPVAEAVFFTDSAAGGFLAAPPPPQTWRIGQSLNLKGPLGRGFSLPAWAQRIALIAVDVSPARLQGVASLGLGQNSEVVLISDGGVASLPVAVEVQPLQAFRETVRWADFIAMDVERENIHRLGDLLGGLEHIPVLREAQILIRTPMPCGGLAECGVCAVGPQHEWKMACREGPVFLLREVVK